MLLLALVVVEMAYFAHAGSNFFTAGNAAEVLRASVEIGLLALALTAVILTGGIDLSVGSLLGLCAILFGKLWRDVHLPIPLAIVLTLCIGALAGGLNAVLITSLRLPPLIVTLGTYSLFRGLAESITHGVDTFTNFPSWFLFLGQERFLGVPAQAPIFLVVLIAIWLLVHRTTFGRSFRAIGFSPEGTRYAGIPVERTGRNPELEVGALLGRREFRSTPALLGALSLEGEVQATVGVAHRFVRHHHNRVLDVIICRIDFMMLPIKDHSGDHSEEGIWPTHLMDWNVGRTMV